MTFTTGDTAVIELRNEGGTATVEVLFASESTVVTRDDKGTERTFFATGDEFRARGHRLVEVDDPQSHIDTLRIESGSELSDLIFADDGTPTGLGDRLLSNELTNDDISALMEPFLGLMVVFTFEEGCDCDCDEDCDCDDEDESEDDSDITTFDACPCGDQHITADVNEALSKFFGV